MPAPIRTICAAALLVAACSSGGGDDVASVRDTDRPDAAAPAAPGHTAAPAAELTDDEREELLLDWAQCMRDHGVESQRDPVRADPDAYVPPGTPSGNIGIVTSMDQLDDPDFEAADRVCEPLRRAGFATAEAPDAAVIAEERDRQLALAQCLRREGLDVPDPVDDGDGTGVAVGATLDHRDPEVRAAVSTCSEEIR